VTEVDYQLCVKGARGHRALWDTSNHDHRAIGLEQIEVRMDVVREGDRVVDEMERLGGRVHLHLVSRDDDILRAERERELPL